MAVVAWLTNEDVWVPVRSQHPASGVVANLSTYPVEVSITRDDPADADFHDATWDGTGPGEDGKTYYWARLEIGPGSGTVNLENDTTYKVYARVTTPTNRPVVYSGTVVAH
jgi:hypothetical protein